MIWRTLGIGGVLAAFLLLGFARLVADPTGLIADLERPSVDHARLADDHSNGNDLTRLFLPHHLAIARAIANTGHLPLWDDRGFGGRPLVGNPQAGLFYPPVWLAWWSVNPAAMGWITVGHLLFAGIGTYQLGRKLGLDVWGAAFAGGCVETSPYVFGQTFEGHYPHVWAACWYPWAFLAAQRLRGGDVRAVPLLGLTLAATILAGHPQEGFYLLIALGAWAAWDGMAIGRSGRWRVAAFRSGSWLVALALAIGLAGVEWIPDRMTQPWCLRAARLPVDLASRYHLYPSNFLQLLGPFVLGGPADYLGHENYWESVTSIGLIPLILAIVGVSWSRDRRAVRGWVILLLASLVFASGRKLGFFALLYDLVPGMDRFRVPARSLFLASLAASMLAGMGVDALGARAADSRAWARLARRSAILAALLLGFVWIGGRPSALDAHLASGRIAEYGRMLLGLGRLRAEPVFHFALAGMVGLLATGWLRPDRRRLVAALLGLLGLIELGCYANRLMVITPVTRIFGLDPISRSLRTHQPTGQGGSPRIRVVDAIYDDLKAERSGFLKTNVNDSFQIQHAADLYQTLYHLFDDPLEGREGPMDADVYRDRLQIRQAVLDRMAVSLVVSDHDQPAASWRLEVSGRQGETSFFVSRNLSCLPRAYVVPRSRRPPDESSILRSLSETDGRDCVLMSADPLGLERGPRQPFRPAEWTSIDPDRVVLQVSTEAPGLLVVADTWMPGWSAEVDGHRETILRGNHAQRVIPLTVPGRHVVVLTYQAPGLFLGLGMTLGSVAVGVALLILPRRRTIRQPSDDCH